MTALQLTSAERLKFALLADGLLVDDSAAAAINAANRERPIAIPDYASTSGVILELEGDVWVNAPTADHNANFVERPDNVLTVGVCGGLVVESPIGSIPARVWLQPRYHFETGPGGLPFTRFGVTHTDRVRVSPIEGCAYTCTFCDLPYEYRYRAKDVESIVATVAAALSDPDQPAAHVLVSGGTPRPGDFGYVRECYEAILETFPETPVDIMMVPLHEVLDLADLAQRGLAEVSINMEVWDDAVARRVMPRKHKEGREHYLDYLAEGASVLGGQRVRSMLMLGLEPLGATLEGVAAIAELGCVPVLSPFRPDPATPLRDWAPPSAEAIEEAYAAAWAITSAAGVPLGPPCLACAHNTVTLPAARGHGSADHSFGQPLMAG